MNDNKSSFGIGLKVIGICFYANMLKGNKNNDHSQNFYENAYRSTKKL